MPILTKEEPMNPEPITEAHMAAENEAWAYYIERRKAMAQDGE